MRLTLEELHGRLQRAEDRVTSLERQLQMDLSTKLIAPVGTGQIDVQTFTTPGSTTWTKPTGAVSVYMECVGGGGGAGGGAGNTVGNVRTGGGGGAGGCRSVGWFAASSLPASLSVEVGAGGAGGAGGSMSDGVDGTAGTESYVRVSSTDYLLRAAGGARGLNGHDDLLAIGGGGAADAAGGMFIGSAGGVGGYTTSAATAPGGTQTPPRPGAPSGGGGGAAVRTEIAYAGGAGQSIRGIWADADGQANDDAGAMLRPGLGGDGGDASTSTTGGHGENGVRGGGGGGGGAGTSVGGDGGDGGDGYVFIVTFF